MSGCEEVALNFILSAWVCATFCSASADCSSKEVSARCCSGVIPSQVLRSSTSLLLRIPYKNCAWANCLSRADRPNIRAPADMPAPAANP